MDVPDLVTRHYGGRDLSEAILAALAQSGVDINRLTPADFAPVDQLHAGFAPATRHLLDKLDLRSGARLLDLGCGIGGTARMAASAYGAQVRGIDLSPEFIEAARRLTAVVGLEEQAGFEIASGDALPFEDASFDRVSMIHVGMNLPDKRAVFNEVRRVLRPGGLFGLFEQMRTADGPLPYPLPWAVDERSSFVASPAEYAEVLAGAGLTLTLTDDRTEAVAGPPPVDDSSALTPAVIFGPEFGRRIANNIAATRAGLLGAVLMLARA